MAKKSQIRIGFEPGDNDPSTSIWDRDDFRLFIKSLQEDTKVTVPFVFYIITTETDTDFIEHVANIFGVDSENIVYVDDLQEKFEQIETLGINMYFTGSQGDVDYIATNTTPATSSSTYPTNNGILVNYLQNNSTLTMKYIDKFRAILATLI